MESISKKIIADIYPFSKLEERKLERLIESLSLWEYPRGHVVYREGDLPDYLYLLIKGRLIALTGAGAKERSIELIKKRTPFGIISLFTGEPHSVTVKSIEDSIVLKIGKEEFKKFLEKIPFLAIDFSRILSKRVKKRAGKTKTIFQSTKIGICSFSKGAGKTTYMLDLVKTLEGEIKKDIIAVEFSRSEEFSLPRKMNEETKYLNLSEFKEAIINDYINKEKFSWLCVNLNGAADSNLFSLLNYLSENYHFVFYELPFMDKRDLAECIVFGDITHFFVSPGKKEIAAIRSFMKIAGESISGKMKLILAEHRFIPKEEKIKFPFYASIPFLNNADYHFVLRRIARELGDKTLGLALGSGGAFCFSHHGVLKVLEEEGVSIDVISGSSVGSVIAALWALGMSAQEREELIFYFAKKMSFIHFGAFSLPFKGFLRSKKLAAILKKIFGRKTFRDLKYPLRIVAFDFIKKRPIVIKEGFLYKAVAASCAMPGVFDPVIFKGNILLDGGVLNPLPVQFLLDYVKKIIAVNVTPSREETVKEYVHKKRFKFNILDFIFGSIETMQREFIDRALKLTDVVIHPGLEGLRWTEFNKVEEFIRRGEEAARIKLEEIKNLINE